LIATHEVGAAIEMPCAAPPTRVYPAGTATAEAVAAGLAAVLPDAVADCVAEAEVEGFTVDEELPHAVTATPIPITTGTAKNATLMRTFPPFLVIEK
jgi:hypothetical protein